MQPATAPYILRAIYKDEYLTDTYLARPATELMTSVAGAHFTNRYDSHIIPVATGLYTLFSMTKGQTLGQEFCDLLPATQGNTWRSVGATRKTLLSLLQVVEPTALFYAARRLSPGIPPHDVTTNVYKAVLCLLFLFERYGTIPHRLTQIRFVSLKPARVLNASDGAAGSYLVLGLVLLVELVVRLWRYSKQRAAQTQQERQQEHEKGDRTRCHDDCRSSSDDEEQARTSGKCMLCLSHRKNPAATQCGHIFCWQCASEWIQSNPREALCPFCRQRITLQSLVPLYFYVAKEPPHLGSASTS